MGARLRRLFILLMVPLLATPGHGLPLTEWLEADEVGVDGSESTVADAWWLMLGGGQSAPSTNLIVDAEWLSIEVGRSEQDVVTPTDVGERTNDTIVYEGPARILATEHRAHYNIALNASDAPGTYGNVDYTALPPGRERITTGDSPASDRPPMQRDLAGAVEVDQPRGPWNATGEVALWLFEVDMVVITPDEMFEVWTGYQYTPPGSGLDDVPVGGSGVYQDAIITSQNGSVALTFPDVPSTFFAWSLATRVNGTVTIDSLQQGPFDYNGLYDVYLEGTKEYGLRTRVVEAQPEPEAPATDGGSAVLERDDRDSGLDGGTEASPSSTTAVEPGWSSRWLWLLAGPLVPLGIVVGERATWRRTMGAMARRDFHRARRLSRLFLWGPGRRGEAVTIHAVATAHTHGPDAAEAFLHGLRDDHLPDPASLEYLLATIRLAQGRVPEAVDHVKACLALNPALRSVMEANPALGSLIAGDSLELPDGYA